MTDATYSQLSGIIDEFASSLEVDAQVACLYVLITPLLGRIEQAEEEYDDVPVPPSSGVVRALRRAAAGEPVDADAVHERLTAVALTCSEDQDSERHIMAASALAAAAWLGLREGRELRTASLKEGFEDGEDLVPPYAPSVFTQIVDLLAWTRSGQMYTFWEDAGADPDLCDLPAATREPRAMYLEITA
ncbi:hypothetical protein [Streptomyces sp. I05A-00742]|uniref:hypothetical protein n=1 Tax=Streptomyces sp. I05A-00742 TaxID=2732853 RepID=UPI0014895C0F|nr:hypothetical protein [Streptomyces sp. I05A-00742]